MATYIGLDLGGTNIKISVFDDFFHKLGEKRTPTEVRFGSEHVLNRIYDAILALLDELHLTCQDITCMGIGVPGILDIKNGISRFSPNFPKWEEVPIVAWMESHLHIPTYIDNDARVNLYGEWKFGAGKNRNNVLMITLGTGLGGAAVIDGRVIYGATGSAGEIGHINMFREGRECRCGSSGCLGRYVSALGILRTFREKVQLGQHSIICDWVDNDLDKVTADMLSRAYDDGDAVAIETMRETGELLGYGLCAVFSLYNPEIIIVGGGMSVWAIACFSTPVKFWTPMRCGFPIAAARSSPRFSETPPECWAQRSMRRSSLVRAQRTTDKTKKRKAGAIHCGNLRCRHALQHKRAGTD